MTGVDVNEVDVDMSRHAIMSDDILFYFIYRYFTLHLTDVPDICFHTFSLMNNKNHKLYSVISICNCSVPICNCSVRKIYNSYDRKYNLR